MNELNKNFKDEVMVNVKEELKKQVSKMIKEYKKDENDPTRKGLKLYMAYNYLDELCSAAQETGLDVNNHYAVIIECLRRLDLVATISLALDTTVELTDERMLREISKAVFDDYKLLFAIEKKEW